MLIFSFIFLFLAISLPISLALSISSTLLSPTTPIVNDASDSFLEHLAKETLNTTPLPNATEEKKKQLKVGILTWNLAEKSPSLSDCIFLKEFFTSTSSSSPCDLIVLGIQECENIKPRRKEGKRSRKWRELIHQTFPIEIDTNNNRRRKQTRKNQNETSLLSSYEIIGSHKLGGMQLAILANSKAKNLLEGIQTIEIPCGVGNVLSNKGGICMLLRMEGKTIAFINSHLAAHHHKVKGKKLEIISCLIYCPSSFS